MPMPEAKEAGEKRRLACPRRLRQMATAPMSRNPTLKREKEQSCALHSDSRTKMHSEPMSMAASMAASVARACFFFFPPMGAAELGLLAFQRIDTDG